MLFHRLETPGLAHHSYILECGEGACAVVDPRRDVGEYIRIARENGLSITWVLQTHRHEDLEIGSAHLAEVTGAKILTGAQDHAGRADLRLADGEGIDVGGTRIVVHETPGHTPESVCYAVHLPRMQSGPWAVFTGDALFAGSTGRTDLAGQATAAENAGILFDTIHAPIAPLGDGTLLFPAHGSGSACGTDIADRDVTSLGLEKKTNPVFVESRASFVEHKRAERIPRPPYFSHMERVNRRSGRPFAGTERARALAPTDFERAAGTRLVIDVHEPGAFAACHLPGSCNVWLDGLASLAGWVADERSPIALAGGIAAWREQGLPIAISPGTSARECAQWWREGRARVLDVRDDAEWDDGHVPGAIHVYVGHLEKNLPGIGNSERVVVHCSVGNRAGLAASILERAGFTDVHNMLGGMKAWRALGLPVEKA